MTSVIIINRLLEEYRKFVATKGQFLHETKEVFFRDIFDARNFNSTSTVIVKNDGMPEGLIYKVSKLIVRNAFARCVSHHVTDEFMLNQLAGCL